MSIYLLHGGNSFARKNAKKQLIDQLSQPGDTVNNFFIPAGAGAKNLIFEQIRQKLTGGSLFGTPEIMAVSFLAQDKPGRGRTRSDGGIETELIHPWLPLVPSNITLVIEIAAELPKTSHLLKLVESQGGQIQLFKKPLVKNWDALSQAAREYLAKEKVKIDPYLLNRLVGASQGDWWYVFSALEQAVLLKQSGELQSENLLKLWGLGEDQNIFQLFEQIGNGNKAKALVLLFENTAKKALKTGQEVEQALGLISLMARQLGQLIAVKSGADAASAQKDWQIPFFALPKLKQQAAHFSTEFLAQAYEKLAELQEKAKRGLYSPLPLIDFYVLYFISHRDSL